jgi:glycosyltransferase involved in cell wall biosynthesis
MSYGHGSDRPFPPATRRILIVSNLFPPHVMGGAEVVAQRQAHRLQARGHSVCVFAGWAAPAGQSGRLEVEDDNGLRIWRTPVSSFEPDDNFFVPSVETRLQSVLKAERPDIVHFHNLCGLGFSLVPLVKRRGLPAIVTLHDHAGYCYRATALRPDERLCDDAEECALACRGAIVPREVDLALPMRLRRDYVAWALAHADRLISPSAALAACFRNAGAASAEQLEVISNGIDLAPFQALMRRPSDGVRRFACISYLGEHKGIPDLLQAAARLAAESDLAHRWSLTIAGDGHLREQVEAAIASGRFGDAVTYVGRAPRKRIVSELSVTDVVVLPSRWPENEPVVLLEAIAAGAAQLATNLGGIPDLVEQGVTGELVPSGDPEALADAMAAYIREPARARRHGEANLARRNRFSEEASLDAIEAVYELALRAPRSWASDRPLVLCAGDGPLPQVAEICNHLYRLEDPCAGARLIWHSWADAGAWDAALLWNWSSGANSTVMQRALCAGVPILAPSSCAIAGGIERSFGAAMTYDSFLEGLIALARIPHDSAALESLRRNCRQAGALLAATAPPDRYHLPTPALPG